MKLRVYDMAINDADETGVDINSFVDAPAHMRSFDTYNKGKKTLFAISDNEKRIVTGVAILADFLIYRNDKQLGEHYVKFSPETIWKIRNKFFKNGFQSNTNVQHATMVQGAILVDSFIVHDNDPRLPKVPQILASQRVTNGSWVVSYYVENEKLWQDCKNGIFKGFSVEGYFDKIETVITNKSNMSKDAKKKSFLKNIFGGEGADENMSEVTSVDGTVLFYDGDLAVGTAVMIEANGKKIAAPEGDHEVTVDGVTYAITLDAEGKVTAMDEVTEMSEEAEMLSEAIKKMHKDANAKFAIYDAKIAKLEADLKVAQAGKKFGADGKKSEGDDKKGFKSLLK